VLTQVPGRLGNAKFAGRGRLAIILSEREIAGLKVEECDIMTVRIEVPREKLAAFCRANHISRLAFFGSVVRDDFRTDSDIDVLVEFDPDHVPGLLGIARMERELSEILGGRQVDLRTLEDLSRYFRAEVYEQAEVQFAEIG
jgi:predicted nucleotidyltransferase